jgi:hypothetical protein
MDQASPLPKVKPRIPSWTYTTGGKDPIGCWNAHTAVYQREFQVTLLILPNYCYLVSIFFLSSFLLPFAIGSKFEAPKIPTGLYDRIQNFFLWRPYADMTLMNTQKSPTPWPTVVLCSAFSNLLEFLILTLLNLVGTLD